MAIDFGTGDVGDDEVGRDGRVSSFLAVSDIFQESVSLEFEALDTLSEGVVLRVAC